MITFQVQRLIRTQGKHTWTVIGQVLTRAHAEADARHNTIVAGVPHRIIPVVDNQARTAL